MGKARDKSSSCRLFDTEYGMVCLHGMAEGEASWFDWDLSTPLPHFITPFIVGFSLKEAVPLSQKRLRGVYCLHEAKGVFDYRDELTLSYFEARGPLDDLAELYSLFRQGKILPVQSWEGEQTRRRALWTRFSRLLRL